MDSDIRRALINKQDRIAGVKIGLLTKGDGQDGDIGLCKHNGITFIAIKNAGEWYFAEAKKSTKLSDGTFFVKG